MAVGPTDISHLRVKENHIKSAREVEDSISTIIRRLLHKYLPMQPDDVLVQNAEAAATSNPTCYYLSFLPFPPYIFFFTPVYHHHQRSRRGMAEKSAYRSVVNALWNREARSPPGSDSARSFSQDIQKFSA